MNKALKESRQVQDANSGLMKHLAPWLYWDSHSLPKANSLKTSCRNCRPCNKQANTMKRLGCLRHFSSLSRDIPGAPAKLQAAPVQPLPQTRTKLTAAEATIPSIRLHCRNCLPLAHPLPLAQMEELGMPRCVGVGWGGYEGLSGRKEGWVRWRCCLGWGESQVFLASIALMIWMNGVGVGWEAKDRWICLPKLFYHQL